MECDQDSGVVLVGLCLGRLGGLWPAHIYTRAPGLGRWGAVTDARSGRMPRAAPPAHAPGKEKLAGRLCTDVRVRHWGVEVEFEARPRAGTGPDRLSIGIYARLVV